MEAVVPLDPTQTATAEEQAAHEDYLERSLVAVDTLANVLFGGRPGETISTRAARGARRDAFAGRLISHILDALQSNHGAQAAAGDLERAEAEAATIGESGLIAGELPPAGTH